MREAPLFNMVAYLDDSNLEMEFFAELIRNLKRSRIHHAISVNPLIHKTHQIEFWKTAQLGVVDEVETISAQVQGMKIVVTEEILSQVLQFGDAPDHPVGISGQIMRKCVVLMKYQGPDSVTLQRNLFPPVWRYLLQVIVQCISNRKGGVDTINALYTAGMVTLILNKPFNFSKITFLGLKENLSAENDQFMLFPRFLQEVINAQHPNIPYSGVSLNANVMRPVQINGLRKISEGRYKFDSVKAGEVNLFGFFAGNDDFDIDAVEVVDEFAASGKRKRVHIPFSVDDNTGYAESFRRKV